MAGEKQDGLLVVEVTYSGIPEKEAEYIYSMLRAHGYDPRNIKIVPWYRK